MSTASVSELGYLFLTLSSLHVIAPDLDVRDHLPWWHSKKIIFEVKQTSSTVRKLFFKAKKIVFDSAQ